MRAEPEMRRPASVKLVMGWAVFFSVALFAIRFFLLNDESKAGPPGLIITIAASVSGALALLIFFGKRRKWVYWVVTAALVFFYYRHVMSMFQFPHRSTFELVMKVGINLLLLWLILSFIFGRFSRVYYRILLPSSRGY